MPWDWDKNLLEPSQSTKKTLVVFFVLYLNLGEN